VHETRRRFGNIKHYRRKLEHINRNRAAETVHRCWVRFMCVLHDVRNGVRVLSQHRSFTLVAVLTLALGIGANTAIFSVINSLLMRPLNVAEPERLVTVFTSRSGGELYGETSYPDYLAYRRQNEVFSGLVAHSYAPMAISGSDQAVVVWGQLVSWDYFSVLGVEPRLGRTFLPEEDATFGASAVTVLSHGTWRDRFGDFAYLYWLRFGYFIGGDSGSELHHHDAPKPGAMHQRRAEATRPPMYPRTSTTTRSTARRSSST
jgi:hypothetical protein